MKIDDFPYDSRQLLVGAPRFGQKTPPLTQWRFESKKCFHNVKINMKRVSGYAIMSDHNEGFFFGRNPCPEHLLVTGESHIQHYFTIIRSNSTDV